MYKPGIIYLCALLLLIFLSSSSLLPQERMEKDKLDSLYEKFVSSRTKHMLQGKMPEVNSLVKPEKCGFSLAAEISINFHSFTAEQQSVLKKLMSRPPELNKSIISPRGHFRIHYTDTGNDMPGFDDKASIEENIRQIALIADSVYSFEVNYLGYPPPPSDGVIGGDNLYDIYIKDQGSGYYGITISETSGEPEPSYIEIDNDFVGSGFATHSYDAAKITLAHEFHHAIQFGSYGFKASAKFFHEMSSTAMEDFVFDDVNDYYKGPYIKDYFSNSREDYFTCPTDNAANGYRIAIWDIFLRERFGYTIIKRQWDLFKSMTAIEAIDESLSERQTSLRDELNEFGIWTYYTGYRAIDGKYFKDARHFPVIRYFDLINYSDNSFPVRLSTYPLSNLFLGVLLHNDLRIDTLVIKLTDGDISRAYRNPGELYDITYNLFQGRQDDARRIVNNYYSKMSPGTGVLKETDFLNNDIVNDMDLVQAQSDFAFPNPYRYNCGRNVMISLPVASNELQNAEISIFTVNMDLVYSGVGAVYQGRINKSLFVKWNGLDLKGMKLPTGIYIYLTDSNGNIKQGKIVIQNE